MKKLLAIAVTAALVAPAAAMADTTLYGKLHAAQQQVKTTTAAGSTTNTDLVSTGSRLGIKGATALDNGLEAVYMLEYGINIADDQGLATSTARQTFAGLKGGFGEVRMGSMYGPTKLVSGAVDQFTDQLGDYNNIVNGNGTVEGTIENTTAYINKFGPVGVAVAHTSSATAAANGVSGVDAMVNYSNGPIYAGVGHQKLTNSADVTRVAAAYAWEAGHKVGYVHEINDTGVVGASKRKNNLVSGSYKMGNTTLKAQYGTADSGVAGAVKEKMTAVGVDYSLGKKTSVYGEYVNHKNTNRTPAGSFTSGNKASGFGLGLMTEF